MPVPENGPSAVAECVINGRSVGGSAPFGVRSAGQALGRPRQIERQIKLRRALPVWRYSGQVPPVFLQSWGPLLVALHALSAIVLCGASVHQAVLATLTFRGRAMRRRLVRVYALTTLLSYVGTMFVGALLYPRYRVVIRALYLDRHAPWAANLFDFKENLATLGLPLAVGALWLAWSLSQPGARTTESAPNNTPSSAVVAGRGTDPAALRIAELAFLVMAVGTALVSVTCLLAGLVCTAVRGA